MDAYVVLHSNRAFRIALGPGARIITVFQGFNGPGSAANSFMQAEAFEQIIRADNT